MNTTASSIRPSHLLLAIGIVALIAVPTIAWAAGGPSWPARSPMTVEVFEPASEAAEALHDLDGDGFTAGDVIIERAVLRDPGTGDEIGRAIEDIRIVGVTEPPSEQDPLGDWDLVMDATFALEDGNLTFGGHGTIADFAGDGAVFPVRGGTGAYVGVRGTATIALTEVGGEVGPLITFDLAR